MSAIYVHIPFCKSRCIYCGFYSTTLRGKSHAYVDALIREMDERRHFLPASQPLRTIYIGGGTPSQLDPEELRRLLAAIASHWDVSQVAELTIEANPEDITPEWCAAVLHTPLLHSLELPPSVHGNEQIHSDTSLGRKTTPTHSIAPIRHRTPSGQASAGPGQVAPPVPDSVGRPKLRPRISLGVQSMVDDELTSLGRRHTAQRVREAVQMLRSVGIANISLDLMYGLPVQTVCTWQYSIDQLLALHPQHISAYNLQVEDGTRLKKMLQRKAISIADDETCLAMIRILRTRLKDAGYEHYEISNFALPGYASLHNSGYWDGTPYLGLGSGAHSYDGDRLRSWNAPHVIKYIAGGRDEGHEILSDTDLYNERIMLGLRTARGVPRAIIPDSLRSAADDLCRRGLIKSDGTMLRVTDDGLPLADEVMRNLFLV